MSDPNYYPAPRECATMVSFGNRCFLTGGINYDVVNEFEGILLSGDTVTMYKLDCQNPDKI